MSDQMSIDPGLLPHVFRQLGALSARTQTAGSTVRGLAGWAGGANPALGAAAQELTRASRALDETTKQLDATRRDIDRRASLLELEQASGGRAALTGAKRGDMDSNAGDDADPSQSFIERFWYTLLEHDTHNGTVDFGLGLLHAEMGDTDSAEVQKGSSIDILSANGRFGLLDPDTGRTGFVGSAQGGRLNWIFGHNSFGIQSLEVDVARASAESSLGPDGITIGAGASLLDAAVTYGQPSKDSAADTQVKVGGGVGIGFGGALHWSDDDKDGEREYGFGVDFKFASFDYKSEALDEAWNEIVPGVPFPLSDDPTRRFSGGIKPLVS
jgi:hypothetical protein